MFDGFDERRVDLPGVTLNLRIGGSGPPLVCLHGYPQTHVMWHKIAPALAEHFTVVLPDLRGYGDSSKPPAGDDFAGYSKRQMAQDIVALMDALGFDHWHQAGHDRGARVSYRMALDHPDRVKKLCVMDIIPTIEQYELLGNRKAAIGGYHWFFLAQPAPFPERLIGADPDYYLRHSLQSWGSVDGAFADAAVAEYVRCFSNPDTIRATCDCYRAGATIDCEIDEASREAGDKISCPMLVLWGDRGGAWDGERSLETWRRWATDVQGQGVPNGHFCPEEAPEETLAAMLNFFNE